MSSLVAPPSPKRKNDNYSNKRKKKKKLLNLKKSNNIFLKKLTTKYGSFDDIRQIDNIDNLNKKYNQYEDEYDEELSIINKNYTRKILLGEYIDEYELEKEKEKKEIKEWLSSSKEYKILFITGPMFSGKTKLCAELLDNKNDKIIFFKPEIYKNDINISRPHSRNNNANKILNYKINDSHEFISIDNEDSLEKSFKKIIDNNIKTVIFEEAQFFKSKLKKQFFIKIKELTKKIKDIKIFIVFLNYDFRKKIFGFMLDLHKNLKQSNEIDCYNVGWIRLTAKCHNNLLVNKNCTGKAEYTCKKMNSINDLSQNENDYIAVCNNCYDLLKKNLKIEQ